MRLRPAIGFALVLLFGCGSRTGLLGSGVEGTIASMSGSGAVGAGAGSGGTSATGSSSISATGGGSASATGTGSTSAGSGAGTGATPDSAADGGTDDASAPTCALGPSAALPPSCASGGPGMTNCGACESCCTSLEVPGGAFYRTYDLDPDLGGANSDCAGRRRDGIGRSCDREHLRSRQVRRDGGAVPAVRERLERRSGLHAEPGSGKHTHLNGGEGLLDVGASPDAGTVVRDRVEPIGQQQPSRQRTPTWLAIRNTRRGRPEAGSNENRPINCVSWLEAYAFCIWDGGFLPSEAEWEYAAAGGNQQRTYPWGSADPGTESQYAIYGCYYPSGPPGFMCSGALRTSLPVGTAAAGAGRFGQLDLAGEMCQWTLDWSAEYWRSHRRAAWLRAPIAPI